MLEKLFLELGSEKYGVSRVVNEPDSSLKSTELKFGRKDNSCWSLLEFKLKFKYTIEFEKFEFEHFVKLYLIPISKICERSYISVLLSLLMKRKITIVRGDHKMWKKQAQDKLF